MGSCLTPSGFNNIIMAYMHIADCIIYRMLNVFYPSETSCSLHSSSLCCSQCKLSGAVGFSKMMLTANPIGPQACTSHILCLYTYYKNTNLPSSGYNLYFYNNNISNDNVQYERHGSPQLYGAEFQQVSAHCLAVCPGQ